MAARIVTTLVLAATAVFGYFSILGLAERNGWAAMLRELMARDDAVLPGTDQLGRTQFTGVEPLDYLIFQLVRFFYVCASGQLPTLSIFAAYMAGQVLAMHTAVELEGLRSGNEGTVMSL
jgi:hypothetical protein